MTLAPWPYPLFGPLNRLAGALGLALLLVLAGCATPGPGAPSGTSGHRPAPAPAVPGQDGPPLVAEVDPQQVPDAEPKVEAIRPGGPNKPYEVAGQTYVPATADVPLVERGLASWYGRKFHGRRTASGEIYNMNAMSAAHRTMPIPSYAKVRNPANGREVIVRVNDRGPFVAGRVMDLSYAAAARLGVLNGVAPVEVERLTNDQIRAGLVSRPATRLAAAPAANPGPDLSGTLVAQAPAPAVVPAPAVTTPVLATALLPADLPAVASSTALPQLGRTLGEMAAGFWLQLGAFGKREGAISFQQRVVQELDWLSPVLAVITEGGLHRLQAGPYASRDQAREVAERVRTSLQLVPVVVERR